MRFQLWLKSFWLGWVFSLTACASTTITVPVPQTVLVPATVLVTVRVTQPVTVEVEVTRLAQVIVTATPTPLPSATPTSLNTPTPTLVPSSTPSPSATPIPTRTSRPTITPTFTPSPFPTVTPSNTPDPFFFSRVGNALLPIIKPALDGPALLHIVGNPAQTFFSIKNVDVENNVLNILVNTTTAYSGTVLIDLLPEDHTQQLEINASGGWTIRVFPLSAARTLTATPLTGFGDDVIRVPSGASQIRLTGNAGSNYLGVFAYYARTRDLIVNATTPYADTITLPEGTTVLEVKAVGEWKIELK